MQRRIFILLLLAIALFVWACKGGGEQPASTSNDDEVRYEGAVVGIDSKVIDKEAREKEKGLLKIAKILDGEVDIADKIKIEVWKPGADPEEHKAETSRWGTGDIELAPGTWDVRLINDEGPMSRAEGWIRNVPVAQGKMWKADLVRFHYPMQYLRVETTLAGENVTDGTKTTLFEAGADVEEVRPLHSFWGNSRQAVAEGVYDLVLTRDKGGVKSDKIIRNFEIGGDRQVRKVTFALDADAPTEPVEEAAPQGEPATETAT